MPSPPPPEPSILILGAGTFGTSTAYHLAKTYRNSSLITVIDRWSPASSLEAKTAAAVDTNRIIRTDYASHLYCNLANSALHFWFWSIAVQGHFHKTGWTVLEREDGVFGEGVKRTFKERGGEVAREVTCKDVVQHKVLDGLDEEKWTKGYFNPEAGWCDAERATASFAKVAFELGVQRITGDIQELLLDQENSRIKGVRLADGRTVTADKVVLAAGAWSSSILSPVEDALNVPEQDRIERQITAVGRLSAYYTLSEQETQTMIDTRLPVIVLAGLADIIPPSQPNRTLKINDLRTEVVNTITTPSGHRITAPSKRNQNDVPASLVALGEKVVHEALPSWTHSRRPDRWRVCYDAVTPTEDWLMCRHPSAQLGNLYIAVGGSFHSYKSVSPIFPCARCTWY